MHILADAIDHYDDCGIAHAAAGCRYRLGQLVGDERGADLMDSAIGWLEAEGIANPPAMINLLCPGFDDEPD